MRQTLCRQSSTRDYAAEHYATECYATGDYAHELIFGQYCSVSGDGDTTFRRDRGGNTVKGFSGGKF